MPEIRLHGPRVGAGETGAQLQEQRRRERVRVIERQSLRAQRGVLNAGDEGAEIEFRQGEIRRRQTATGLSLRRVQTIILEAVTREEFVALAEFVIDANGEGVADGAT